MTLILCVAGSGHIKRRVESVEVAGIQLILDRAQGLTETGRLK
jgi:hypothetical protein